MIEIVSEDFFLPWELLYSVDLDSSTPLSYEHFWGFNHIIHRAIPVDTRADIVDIPIDKVKLGLLADAALPSVEEKAIPFFRGLADTGKISLSILRSLKSEKKREEIEEFKRFWREERFNLAHFDCHASYNDTSPVSSFIKVSDGFEISLKDLNVYNFLMKNAPLVILNACETSKLNPLYTSNFVKAFLEYGARGVVATECAVPDDFAVDFAEELYVHHLLEGKQLGESLLETRRFFLRKYYNPSGLLYSMYARPSIRFAKS